VSEAKDLHFADAIATGGEYVGPSLRSG